MNRQRIALPILLPSLLQSASAGSSYCEYENTCRVVAASSHRSVAQFASQIKIQRIVQSLSNASYSQPPNQTASQVDETMRSMDSRYDTQFYAWVKNPRNLEYTAMRLQPLIGPEIAVQSVAAAFRWMSASWTSSERLHFFDLIVTSWRADRRLALWRLVSETWQAPPSVSAAWRQATQSTRNGVSAARPADAISSRTRRALSTSRRNVRLSPYVSRELAADYRAERTPLTEITPIPNVVPTMRTLESTTLPPLRMIVPMIQSNAAWSTPVASEPVQMDETMTVESAAPAHTLISSASSTSLMLKHNSSTEMGRHFLTDANVSAVVATSSMEESAWNPETEAYGTPQQIYTFCTQLQPPGFLSSS